MVNSLVGEGGGGGTLFAEALWPDHSRNVLQTSHRLSKPLPQLQEVEAKEKKTTHSTLSLLADRHYAASETHAEWKRPVCTPVSGSAGYRCHCATRGVERKLPCQMAHPPHWPHPHLSKCHCLPGEAPFFFFVPFQLQLQIFSRGFAV